MIDESSSLTSFKLPSAKSFFPAWCWFLHIPLRRTSSRNQTHFKSFLPSRTLDKHSNESSTLESFQARPWTLLNTKLHYPKKRHHPNLKSKTKSTQKQKK
jgi:hypothetical protein